MSFDPSAPALAPYLLTPVPRCAVLVDRHTQKNAGSAMRKIYLDNDRKGHFTYWGYAANAYRSVAAKTTSFLASEFTESGRDGRPYDPHSPNATLACRTPSMRYVLEHHYGTPSTEDILETFGPSSPLQYAATRCGCRVVFFTRLREPFSFYASFYRWTVRRTLLKTRFPSACDTAQLPCLTLIRSRPLLSQVYWRQARNASMYGANFTEWAPKNLQASILVSPLDATWAEYVGTWHEPIERAYRTSLWNEPIERAYGTSL